MNTFLKLTSIFGILAMTFFVVQWYAPLGTDDSHADAYGWKLLSKGAEDDAPAFRQIFFFNDRDGIALTIASIHRTNDGGKKWRTSQNFNDVVLSAFVIVNGEIWIVGEKNGDGHQAPILLKSNSYGDQWTGVPLDQSSTDMLEGRLNGIDGICVDKVGDFWLVGDGGMAKAKVVGSEINVSKFHKLDEKYHRIACEDSERIWVVGEEGAVANYNRGVWNYQKLGSEKLFTGIVFNKNEMWLSGTSISKKMAGKGLLLRSENHGLTWENRTPENALSISNLGFYGKTGWAVGIKGEIYSTTDSGSNWSKTSSPTTNGLLSVFFLDNQNVWIAGDRGTILKYETSVAGQSTEKP